MNMLVNFLAVGIACALANPPVPVSERESQHLENLAKTWLDSHPVLKLQLVDNHEGLTGVQGSDTLFAYRINGYSFNLGFVSSISGASSLDEVRSKFDFIGFDTLPVPGLEVPSYWDVSADVPVSSFKEGVLITGFDGQRIQGNVKTRLYAISGSRNDIVRAADRRSEPGSFFQVRRDFQLQFDFDLPIQFARYAELRSGNSEAVSESEANQLEQMALNWIENHPTLRLQLESDGNGLLGVEGSRTLFAYGDDMYRFNLGFVEPLTASASLDDLRSNFDFIGFSKIPVPGYHASAHWDISAETPLSSFKDGVTITAFDGRRLKGHVSTRLYAISGSRNDILPIADGPAEPGSFFQARKDFSLHFDFNLPIHFVQH